MVLWDAAFFIIAFAFFFAAFGLHGLGSLFIIRHVVMTALEVSTALPLEFQNIQKTAF